MTQNMRDNVCAYAHMRDFVCASPHVCVYLCVFVLVCMFVLLKYYGQSYKDQYLESFR